MSQSVHVFVYQVTGVTVRAAYRHDLELISQKIMRSLITALIFAVLAASGPAMAGSKYAGVVIDAKTGKTLYSSSADAHRYPASLTKMMTLYMLFDALDSGRIKKSSQIPISKHAASQPPSKLGLRPGQTISVESAIYALVTKSANDVAAAVGEFIGGSESRFGVLMTRKARALGMRSTTFRNASGLPDSRQVTTARDMATLGLALYEHHPGYYNYFSTKSFSYGKRRYRNHNRLLGNVRGVDGIKTGYTRASGFNLVTSVSKGDRRIVAVVMGGKTGRSRNQQMTNLIGKYLPRASSQNKKRLLVAEKSTKRVVSASAFVALPKSSVPAPSARPAANSTVAPKPKSAIAVDPITTASNSNERGWVIQVASLPSKEDAERFLAKTKSRAGSNLASAEPFTQTFSKDGTVYYRARFAGFSDQTSAVNTCKALKSRKIACFAAMQ